MKVPVLKGSGGCGLLLVQVLVGEEAYKKMLKKYEKENEALKRKLEEVRIYVCVGCRIQIRMVMLGSTEF